MSKLSKFFSGIRFRFRLFPFPFEIDFTEMLSSKSVDERISKLSKIHDDLLDAVEAVNELEKEAELNKTEIEKAKSKIAELQGDQEATKELLKISEPAFARVLKKATKKTRWTSMIIGFILGIFASLIASYVRSLIQGT